MRSEGELEFVYGREGDRERSRFEKYVAREREAERKKERDLTWYYIWLYVVGRTLGPSFPSFSPQEYSITTITIITLGSWHLFIDHQNSLKLLLDVLMTSKMTPKNLQNYEMEIWNCRRDLYSQPLPSPLPLVGPVRCYGHSCCPSYRNAFLGFFSTWNPTFGAHNIIQLVHIEFGPGGFVLPCLFNPPIRISVFLLSVVWD